MEQRIKQVEIVGEIVAVFNSCTKHLYYTLYLTLFSLSTDREPAVNWSVSVHSALTVCVMGHAIYILSSPFVSKGFFKYIR